MISVFPQPASNYLTLEVNLPDGLYYDLLGTNGQKVKFGDLTNEQTNVDVSNIAKGVYMLRVYDNLGTVYKHQKVIIQ